jgi:GGDEF domain-containing protein
MTTTITNTIETDAYERIAAAVREALPGEPGNRLLHRIVAELGELSGQGSDEVASVFAQLSMELERAVATDSVTGLPNLARFMEDLTRCIAAAKHYEEPLAVLLVQARAGATGEDERTLGEALLRVVRVSDVVARIADGRFGIILARTGAVGATLVASRIAGLERYSLALGNATLAADAATAEQLLSLAESSLGEST